MIVQIKDTPVMHSPDPNNTRPLRDAFSRFATGVTVITANTETGPVAITANSFTSVSLDPALVLWCLGAQSNRYSAFVAAQHYSIHVLAADQRELCDLFARDGSALARIPHEHNAQNVPVLSGCIARFDCALRDVHMAGDHRLIVGEVLAAGHRSGPALAFFEGALSPHPA